jgi:hypothetical protein
MLYRRNLAVSVLLLSCVTGFGKDKKKLLLPVDVLQAHTVLVIVDPSAGVSVQDPNANRTAREDVEQALMKWGRLSPVMEGLTADLVITVRKGHGKLVEPTIGGTPANGNPSVVLQPTDSGARIGARTGGPRGAGDPSSTGQASAGPSPQIEAGSSQDTFTVYRNSQEYDPLDSPPVWRYTAKDALQSPGVPAVDVFRKLIAETEKQQAGTP